MKQNTSGKTTLYYGLSGFGLNIISGFIPAYILFFYTEAFGIPMAAASILLSVARVLDAVKDPLLGNLIDSKRTKWGKLRAYFILVPIPLAVCTVLMFLTPNIPEIWKYVYAFGTFLLWSVICTVADIAYLGYPAVLTTDSERRVNIVSKSRVLSTLGGAIPTLLVPLALNLFSSTKTGFAVLATVFGVFGSLMFSIAFFSGKEVTLGSSNRIQIRESIKILKNNRPLLLILIATLISTFRTLIQTMGIYVAKYNFGNESYFTYMAIAYGVGLVAAMLMTPYLLKKMDSKKLFIFSNLIGFVLQLVLYFVGYNKFGSASLYVLTALLFVSAIPFGIYNTLQFSIPADSIDYAEWKTGHRAEGAAISLQTFVNKICAALVILVGGVLLSAAGFIEPINEVPQEQSQKTLDGLFAIVTLIPALSCLLAIVPMLFYNYVGAEREKILAELEARRSASASQHEEN